MVVGHGRLIVLMRILFEVLRLRRILDCRLFYGVEGISQVRLSRELVPEEEFGGQKIHEPQEDTLGLCMWWVLTSVEGAGVDGLLGLLELRVDG